MHIKLDLFYPLKTINNVSQQLKRISIWCGNRIWKHKEKYLKRALKFKTS